MSRRRLQPAVSLDVARAPDVRTLPQERGAIRRAGRGHVVTIGEVVARFHELRAAGALEDTLLAAYRGHNGPVAAPGVLHFLFRSADRARLRAAGDPLPHAGPFA